MEAQHNQQQQQQRQRSGGGGGSGAGSPVKRPLSLREEFDEILADKDVKRAIEFMKKNKYYKHPDESESILGLVCWQGRFDFVKAILESNLHNHMEGADRGQSPLQCAVSRAYCYKAKCFPELIVLLWKYYPSIFLHRDENQNNVFHTIANSMIAYYYFEKPPDEVNNFEDFARILDKYFYEIVKVISAAEFQEILDQKNDTGTTPMMAFAKAGSIYAVNVLLKRNAVLNAIDEKGDTALHLCVQEQAAYRRKTFPELLKLLESNVNTRNKDGNVVLKEIVDWLNKEERKKNFKVAFEYYCKELLEHFVNNNIKEKFLVNIGDKDGDTALMSLVHGNHLSLVTLLLNHYDVDVASANSTGETALSLVKTSGMKSKLQKKWLEQIEKQKSKPDSESKQASNESKSESNNNNQTTATTTGAPTSNSIKTPVTSDKESTKNANITVEINGIPKPLKRPFNEIEAPSSPASDPSSKIQKTEAGDAPKNDNQTQQTQLKEEIGSLRTEISNLKEHLDAKMDNYFEQLKTCIETNRNAGNVWRDVVCGWLNQPELTEEHAYALLKDIRRQAKEKSTLSPSSPS